MPKQLQGEIIKGWRTEQLSLRREMENVISYSVNNNSVSRLWDCSGRVKVERQKTDGGRNCNSNLSFLNCLFSQLLLINRSYRDFFKGCIRFVSCKANQVEVIESSTSRNINGRICWFTSLIMILLLFINNNNYNIIL